VNLRFLTQAAFDDFAEWPQIDKRVFKRIPALIRNIQQTPFAGLGKPEPLKHNLSGYWSRRITGEHASSTR
jgi:toxin YoeB